MENKKLVKILRKDMSELEELISDVKSQGSFNSLEMDFIHTRAKGLMQLIQLIKVDEENGKVQAPLKNNRLEEIKETVAEIQEEVSENVQEQENNTGAKNQDTSVKENSGAVKEEFGEKEPEKPEPVAEEKVKAETPPEKSDPVAEEKINTETPPEKIEPEKKEDKDNAAKEEKPVRDEKENDEMLEQEEAVKSEANSRLGDSFLKGKSLNDLVTDQNKLEFKLSNRPVKSIKTAIGINDRFQYIRELFNGNADKFAKTVNELDSKDNLKQAVDYLRENFKWKKSETSLKFVNLVKRRFQHE